MVSADGGGGGSWFAAVWGRTRDDAVDGEDVEWKGQMGPLLAAQLGRPSGRQSGHPSGGQARRAAQRVQNMKVGNLLEIFNIGKNGRLSGHGSPENIN